MPDETAHTKLTPVPGTAKPVRETPEREFWREARVWSARLVTTLAYGVKGHNRYFGEQGLSSLATAPAFYRHSMKR